MAVSAHRLAATIRDRLEGDEAFDRRPAERIRADDEDGVGEAAAQQASGGKECIGARGAGGAQREARSAGADKLGRKSGRRAELLAGIIIVVADTAGRAIQQRIFGLRDPGGASAGDYRKAVGTDFRQHFPDGRVQFI